MACEKCNRKGMIPGKQIYDTLSNKVIRIITLEEYNEKVDYYDSQLPPGEVLEDVWVPCECLSQSKVFNFDVLLAKAQIPAYVSIHTPEDTYTKMLKQKVLRDEITQDPAHPFKVSMDKLQAYYNDPVQFINSEYPLLVLNGGLGHGKTTMLYALAQGLLGRGYPVINIPRYKLCKDISPLEYSDLINKFMSSAKVFLIDDFITINDLQSMKIQRYTQMLEFLDRAMSSDKRVIITTDITTDNIMANMDPTSKTEGLRLTAKDFDINLFFQIIYNHADFIKLPKKLDVIKRKL